MVFHQGSTATQGSEKPKVGIATARFNWEVTEKLEAGARAQLRKAGLTDDHILAVRVPGAFEIPLAVQMLFSAGCDGVVTCGAVIRGETSHYDYVCNAVERGCSQVQLQFGRPVAFGVLTTDTDEQALDRAGGKHGNKGAEAAEACMEMLNLGKLLKQKTITLEEV